MNLYNPSPTAIDNSAMEVYLTKRNAIEVSFLNLQLTLFCTMNFLKYPFDSQVSKRIPLYSLSFVPQHVSLQA